MFGHGLWCCPSSAGCLWCSWLSLGFGLLLGRVWSHARSACPPPLPVPVCGVGVRAGPGSRLCPALLCWVVGVCFCAFFFLLCGVGCWVSLSWALWSLSPHPLSFGLGCWLFFFFHGVCLHVSVSLFPVGRCSRLGVAGFGWVVPLCLFGGPVFGAFWVGGLAASGGVGGQFGGCGLFSRPPPSPLCFFWGGGLPVPPSAFPGLAHALARIQCGLPGCCWRLRSVWPCSGPMGWVGYVHVGLGAPSCRVRSWICRLGGCARRLRVALGQGVGVVRVLSPLRCWFQPSGWSATVVAEHAVTPCVACGAAVWRAGAAPSGVCAGLLPLVLLGRVSRAVLCRSVPRRVASCCGALHCGALWCVVPWWVSGGQPGLCRGAECRTECGWLVAGGCG